MQPPSKGTRHSGRTSSGRLRNLDRFVAAHYRHLFIDKVVFTDIGIGDYPITTIESAQTFQKLCSDLICYGLDLDPDRVATAKNLGLSDILFERCTPSFRVTFELQSNIIRAMNVFRSYTKEEAEQGHIDLSLLLADGGLLVEGSCSKDGDRMVAHLLRKKERSIFREGIVFSTDFTRGFAPWLFRDWLPCDLRRDTRPGSAMHLFFDVWDRCWQQCHAPGRAPRDVFQETNELLASKIDGVDPSYSHQGDLVWSPPSGVPERTDSALSFEEYYLATVSAI